jgi:hypothetical protein
VVTIKGIAQQMQHAAPTLEDKLLKWATDASVPSKAGGWRAELLEQGIGNLRDLEERAESSRWQRTLDMLSDGLVAKLESWYKEKHPKSKS